MTRTQSLALLTAALLLGACSSERAAGPAADTPTPDAAAAAPSPPTTATPDVATSQAGSPAVSPATAPPEAVLPLEPGVYVTAGTDCTAPANAGLRFYDGTGISGTATHDCRARVLSQRGDTYEVEQSCIDTPSGDGPRTTEAQTVTLHDPRTFTLATADEQSRFTRCDDGDVPDYLHERAGL